MSDKEDKKISKEDSKEDNKEVSQPGTSVSAQKDKQEQGVARPEESEKPKDVPLSATQEQRDANSLEAPLSATQEQRDANSHVSEKEDKMNSINVNKARKIVLDAIGSEEDDDEVKNKEKKEKGLKETNALFFGQKKIKEDDKPKNIIVENEEAVKEIKDMSGDTDKKDDQKIKEDHAPLFIEKKDIDAPLSATQEQRGDDSHVVKREKKISDEEKKEAAKEIEDMSSEDKKELDTSKPLFLEEKDMDIPLSATQEQRDTARPEESGDSHVSEKESRPSLMFRLKSYIKRKKEARKKKLEKLNALKKEKRKKKEEKKRNKEEIKKQKQEKKEKQSRAKRNIEKELKEANKETDSESQDEAPSSATQEQRDAAHPEESIKPKDVPLSATQEQRDANSHVSKKEKEKSNSLTSRFKSYVKFIKEKGIKKLKKLKAIKEEKNKKKEEARKKKEEEKRDIKKEIEWPQPKKEEIKHVDSNKEEVKETPLSATQKQRDTGAHAGKKEKSESLFLKINTYLKKKTADRSKKIEELTNKIEKNRREEEKIKREKREEKERAKEEALKRKEEKKARKDKERERAEKESLKLKEEKEKERKKEEDLEIYKKAMKRKKKGKAMFHFSNEISKKLGKKSLSSTISPRRVKSILLYVFIVSILLFIIFYSFFVIMVTQFNFDNRMTRGLSKILPVPALVTKYGFIEYYNYREASNGDLNIKIELVKEMIKKDEAQNFNINIHSPDLDKKFNHAILSDYNINKYSIDRLKAIQELLNSGSDLENVVVNGDEYSRAAVFSREEAINKFSESIDDLDVGETSEAIIYDKGYYIVKINNKGKDYFNLTYMLVDGKDLNDYLDEKIIWSRIWSLVD